MRFITHTVLSTLFVTGLALATLEMTTHSVMLNSETEQPHLVGNSDRRDTSYRGSGRRVILAFPTCESASDA